MVSSLQFSLRSPIQKLGLSQILASGMVMVGLSGTAIAEPPPVDPLGETTSEAIASQLTQSRMVDLTLPVLQAHEFLPDRDVAFGEAFDGLGGEFGSLPSQHFVSQSFVSQPFISQRLAPQTLAPQTFAQESSLNPPLPGTLQGAIAIIRPQQGQVSIVLTNNTATDVTYEALGHFAPRTLGAAESILLRDVPTPITLTLVRPDGGFLNVTPLDPTETQQIYADVDSTGLLSLALNASGQFDSVQGALTIEQDGRVFIQ